MAAIETTHAPFAFTSIFSSLFKRTLVTIRSSQDIRATRNALSGLSDRELDDIGLTRGDIDVIDNRL